MTPLGVTTGTSALLYLIAVWDKYPLSGQISTLWVVVQSPGANAVLSVFDRWLQKQPVKEDHHW